MWIIAQAWFLARLFVYLSSNISQILDFLYWTGLNFYFWRRDSENTGAELTYVGRYVGKMYTKQTSCNSFPCKVWWLECEQLFLHILRGMYGKTIRSLSKDDGDVNKNGKKQYIE